ncbi:MAG: agmatinase [Patescibacteria group bacterium]|nr:agmatinase [Patescibacteria group bacterium]
MKKLYDLWPFNFGTIKRQDFSAAKVVVLPIPYEATVSSGTGTSAGPQAIIESSRELDELDDPKETGEVIGLHATDIFTLDEVNVSKNSALEAIAGIEQAVNNEVIRHNKIPLMLGGEHTITIGAVRALRKKYRDISILHLDAHTDLMNSLDGTKYSHACTMRRISELKIPFVSIGIRNMNPEVREYIKAKKLKNIYFAPEIPPLEKILKGLTKNVYLTFDLDCLDPSIMPSVGTPEPGGLGWYQVLEIINKVAAKVNLVGADVVELKPIPGLDAPNFLAAKLTYNIIINLLRNK